VNTVLWNITLKGSDRKKKYISTITFADSLQTNGPHVITLDGPLNVTAPIEIIGPGRETLFISGDDSHRVFSLSGSTAANPHRLRNLTIQNGRATLGGQQQQMATVITLVMPMVEVSFILEAIC